jgi:hypothetical protein
MLELLVFMVARAGRPHGLLLDLVAAPASPGKDLAHQGHGVVTRAGHTKPD